MYSTYYREEEPILDGMRKILAREIAPHIDSWERDDHFPDEVFEILGNAGYLGLLIPEKYGGIDAGYKVAAGWCEVFGELPAVGMTTGVNMHSLIISHAVSRSATDEVKENWLPRAAAGTAIGAYAFTEPGAGSDLARIRTKAERSGSVWRINGSKTFITNGARADFVLVLARTDVDAGYDGFTTFLVDTTSPGFKVARKLDKLGWRSSDTAELTLENVEVDEKSVLGAIGGGWIQASQNLNWERLMLTLTSLGGARACLRSAAQYAEDRQAFGRPIRQFDAVAAYLESSYDRVVLGEVLAHHALDLLIEGRDCRAEVSVAKRLICEDAVWIADRAIQIHGGYGYTREFPAERWWRDLRLMTIGGGTSEIMGNIVAKLRSL